MPIRFELARLCAVTAAVAALLLPGPLRADPIMSLALEPAPAGDPGMATERAAVRGHHLLSVRFLFAVAHHPLVVINRGGEPDIVVDGQLWLHSLATYTVANRVAFHLEVPFLLNQSQGDHPALGRAAPGPDAPAVLGDLRLGARLSLLDPTLRARRHFDVALGATAWLPTGHDAYSSDGAFRGAAGLLTDGDAFGFYWSLGAGAKARPPVKLGFTSPLYGGTALTFSAAVGAFLDHGHTLTVGPELAAETAFAGPGPLSPTTTVGHLLFGVHYLPTDGPLEIGAAAGPDLAGGPGKADYQVLLLVGMVPERALLIQGDRDHDGIVDAEDACISTPGVRSDDPEKNGCPPERDTDSDGIADNVDACPTAFGPPSPDPKQNGCPPPTEAENDHAPEAKAELNAEQIVISQQVVFETASAVLLPESNDILKEVARILQEHPEIELLEVQGHTDERGTADFNRKLSQDRAASVVTWLVQQGVERNRLQAKGYGRDRPIADNSTEEGMQKNRRVEFHVLRTRAPSAAEPPPP